MEPAIADAMLRKREISSPAATGAAGTFFEQHVDAYWLAQLLVGAIPPIFLDCVVVEVHFQTERFGWHTDDFLVVAESRAKTHRKLIGQAKRSFTLSAANDECRKAIQDFWNDFTRGSNFSAETDRFALVTLRGTNTLLEHFVGLLDCARASRDAADFGHRLSTPGLISAKAVHYCNEIRTILAECSQRISDEEIWSFLRFIHVLSLDLNSSTGQNEATIKSLLAHTASEADTISAAEKSWNELLREVTEGMPGARSYKRDNLSEELRTRHSPLGNADRHALAALREHSRFVIDGIRSTIGSQLHLSREEPLQRVLAGLESNQVVLISGVAGSGKSGIAKDVIAILEHDHFAFCFRAEEFAHPHLDAMLQSSQIPVSATRLGAILSGQGRKVLLVESVERLLEKSNRDAFTDLLSLVTNDATWRLILTCRDYSADLVRSSFLEFARIDHTVVNVPALSDADLEQVVITYPSMVRPLADVALRRLLRIPYVLDKALQINWAEDRPLPQGEREFRSLFWKQIVRVEHHPKLGWPSRRGQAFVQIALRRAQALSPFANCSDVASDVIDDLRRDSLVVCSNQNTVLAAPAHDALEDWAILQWLDEQHALHNGSIAELIAAIGTFPAVRRSYRKWVGELVEWDLPSADSLFHSVMSRDDIPAHFRDDTLVSMLRSSERLSEKST